MFEQAGKCSPLLLYNCDFCRNIGLLYVLNLYVVILPSANFSQSLYKTEPYTHLFSLSVVYIHCEISSVASSRVLATTQPESKCSQQR